MNQSRLLSGCEAAANVAVGLVTALLVQLSVFPLVGIAATLGQNVTVAGVFTALSVLRGYAPRRLFNRVGP
jgi:hypothetical protein